MHLFIKLRDGFNHDTVTIRVNDREVYHQSEVTTDLTISFADSLEVLVEDTVAKVEVVVEGGLTGTNEVLVQETPYLDVWIIEGKMELIASHEETPML